MGLIFEGYILCGRNKVSIQAWDCDGWETPCARLWCKSSNWVFLGAIGCSWVVFEEAPFDKAQRYCFPLKFGQSSCAKCLCSCMLFSVYGVLSSLVELLSFFIDQLCPLHFAQNDLLFE